MNMSVVDRALWIVERNRDQSLSLNAVAEACGVSRSHLANAFGTASGWPVMKYLRARRMTVAAHQLADGAPDILSLALDFGYGSHEAFTRAFRDHFGHTPEQIRKRGSLDGLPVTPPLKLGSRKTTVPPPVFKPLGRQRLVGLPAACSYDDIITIPAQWQRFMNDHYSGIAHKLQQIPIGVCDVPDDDGCFRYVCAAPVSAFANTDLALTCIEAMPRTYAVFEHNDHVSTVFDTYVAVWNEALPAMRRRVADSPVLEFHNDAFDPHTGLGGLQLWIPLEDA
jgi:AraC family transcriptional regulator